MSQDYTESSIYLFIGAVILFMLLKKFFLGAFIMVWKWFAMAILFPLIYIPDFLTSNVFFFWMDKVQLKAQYYLNVLVAPNRIIEIIQIGGPSAEKYAYYSKFSIGAVNEFMTAMLAPYLLPFFLYYLYKNLNKREFRKIFNIDSLIRDQADLWPQIKPMVEVFPHRIENLDEGEWAMAMQPLQFSEVNNLIEYSENRMGEKKMTLKEQEVIQVFRNQLGREWTGVKDLNQVEKFILAIFISKANRNGKESQKVAEMIAQAYTTEKKYKKSELKKFMDDAINETDRIIQKYEKSEILQDAIAQHYYIKTVLARMLEFARADGVLANADFIWLKIRDRGLWYLLNNVGRNASWIECAGVWHHYNYEKAIERKIPSPNIIGAVAALDFEFRNASEDYIPLDGYNEDQ
tara:strand:+ start:25539 stop:26753 length:1215 start_codon:yes stop_codon:yes gene_type:complete